MLLDPDRAASGARTDGGTMDRQRLTAVLATAAVLSACNTSVSSSPTVVTGTGRLTVQLTDAPIDDVSALNVAIAVVKVKKSDLPEIQVAGNLGPYDILQLKGTTKNLADLGVPAGAYEYVAVDLDPDKCTVVEKASGQTKPLLLANRVVQVLGGFTVPEGGDLTVVLDFRADASLQHLANGDWVFDPVIVQVAP
jgi:hypothetical protein